MFSGDAMIRKETLTTELKKILVYDEKRTVIVIQNLSTSLNVYITDRPKDDVDTAYITLYPGESLILLKAFGDPTEIAYYAKSDGSTPITIMEGFEKGGE